MSAPVICFGQQPCGFFPKRFLLAKIQTAKRLQAEIGGEIVFFYHDSDHDPRESRTNLPHRTTKQPAMLNFAFENKTQRKFSPLYLKRIQAGWKDKTIAQLPNYVGHPLINIFKQANAANVADFCLQIYKGMGLLDGITIMRSSDPEFRLRACELLDCFVDMPYDNEIVRARYLDGEMKLHEGGDVYINIPALEFTKVQVSPARDNRLRWMQSVIHCTHYVAGAGEQGYLRKEDAPEIKYVERDRVERADDAYTELQ